MKKNAFYTHSLIGALLVGSLTISRPASAETYYWCFNFADPCPNGIYMGCALEKDGTPKKTRILAHTDIMFVEDIIKFTSGMAHEMFLQEYEKLSAGNIPYKSGCETGYDYDMVKRKRDEFLQYSPNALILPITVPSVMARLAKPESSPESSKDVLIRRSINFKVDEPKILSSEQQAEMIAQERIAAAIRARTAANQARHSAQVRAGIAEQRRIRRAQGARQ